MEAQRTVSADYRGELNRLAIPYEMYIRIFSYLPTQDLVRCMQVCKVWYDLAMDGGLWFELYKRRWLFGHKVDIRLSKFPFNPLIMDWYGNFRDRFAIKSGRRCVVIDFGGYEVRCANILNNSSQVCRSEVLSVVMHESGIYDCHMRRNNFARWFCGSNALARRHDGNCIQVVERGKIHDATLLPEILYGLYKKCKVYPKQSSVLCLVSPLYCSEADIRPIIYVLRMVYSHYFVRCIPQSVAVCVGNGEPNGIVVNFGCKSGWVSLVINCNSVISEEFELNMEEDQVFSIIEHIIVKSDPNRVCNALFFVGGTLLHNSIDQLQHCYYQRKGTMEHISKVTYNENLDATLLAGVEYANSLFCNKEPNLAELSVGEDLKTSVGIYVDFYSVTTRVLKRKFENL